MKKALLIMAVLGMVLALIGVDAEARTFQDHQIRQFTSTSEVRQHAATQAANAIHLTASDDDITPSGDTITTSASAVPTGKAHRYTGATVSYTGTVSGVRLEIQVGGVSVWKSTGNPTSGDVTQVLFDVWADAAETVDFITTGGTTDDEVAFTVHGVEYDVQ